MKSFIGNLKLAHKFLLIGLIAAFMLAVPSALIIRVDVEKLTMAQAEVGGLEPAGDAIRVLQLAQQHRGLSAAMLSGNQAMGAPNLTDNVWLFGSSEKAISEGIAAGHNVGHEGGPTPMPSFKDTLSPTQIRVLAAYVWGLSNQPPAAK